MREGIWNTPYGRGRLFQRRIALDTIANLIIAGAIAGNGSRVALWASTIGATAIAAAQVINISGGSLATPLWNFSLSLARPSWGLTLEDIGAEITSQVFVFSGTTTQALLLTETVFEPHGG